MPLSPANLCPICRHNLNCTTQSRRFATETSLIDLRATRLSDAGCESQEIMAVTGHRSLKEIERYTRKRNQARLAERAMHKLETYVSTREKWVDKTG
jgi:hypothetical protein